MIKNVRRVTAAVAMAGALATAAMAASPATAAPADARVNKAAAVAGVTAKAVRTDLNGQRFIDRRTNAVYIVLDGKRSWIPNAATYENLFHDWNGIKDVVDIESIALGPNLSSGSFLARANGRTAVYLVTNGVKRHIVSMRTMDKYYFSIHKVHNLPPLSIDSIPTGAEIV
jgi:hypothetical protein